MDDSAITAKVKAALVDHDNIKSTDISVKTDQKVVTLSGFVESQAQAEEAVKVAKGVEGVTSVSDKLHVRDAKEGSENLRYRRAGPRHRWFQLSHDGKGQCHLPAVWL